MNDEQAYERLREEQRLSVRTIDELKQFAENNIICYPRGEGMRIRAYIETEQQLADFLQRAAVSSSYDGFNVPSFVHDPSRFEQLFEYLPTVVRTERDMVGTVQFNDDDPVEVSRTIYPSVATDVYMVSYNQFFEDKPFRINREKVYFYQYGRDIKLKADIVEQLPAVVSFVSVDTFDRMGSIVGENLTFDKLSELSAVPMYA